MASLPPGGKPTDKIPTPRVPKDLKKKGGGKPPAGSKKEMYQRPKRAGASGPQSGKMKPRRNKRMIP